MNTDGALPPVPWTRAVSAFAARAVIVVGGLALTGWALDVPVLRSLGPDQASLKPNTAIACILAGGALLTSAAPGSRRTRLWGRALAIATALIATATLLEYAFGVDLGLDQLLFRDAAGASSPGRMAPNTAAAFLGVAAALLALSIPRSRAIAAAQLLALGVAGLAAITLTGYLYGAPDLFGLDPATRMSLLTAGTLLVLAAGALTSRPADGPVARVLADDMSGRLARRLMLAAATIPLFLGWLRLVGQRAGWYGTESGIGLLVIGAVALLCVVIYGAVGPLGTKERERRRAAEEAGRSLARFESLFESAPDGIVVVDSGGIIRGVNGQAEAMFGYGRDELVGQPIEILVPVGNRERHVAHRDGFIADARTRLMGATLELRGRRRDGSEFPTEISLSSIDFGDGLHVTAIVRDITERRQAQEEIRRLNEDLERRVVERTAELEEANRELEAFSYSVSHDLRAPLRSLDGFTTILLERHEADLPAEARRYLGIIRDSAGDMGRLIDALLAFSQLGRQTLAVRRVDPAASAREALADLEAARAGRSVEISIGELPSCRADPRLLRQVFANLLENALKFTRARETARIEVGALAQGDGDETAYYVRDNGAGFDMRYADKLFGVFQRLHRVDEFEGTGVGLATVARIVHRHGGRVWAEGAVDGGATFYFTMGGTEP